MSLISQRWNGSKLCLRRSDISRITIRQLLRDCFRLHCGVTISLSQSATWTEPMITETTNYFALVEKMPEDTVVIFHNATWDDYEELLTQVGEASGLRISFNDGTLKVMTLSPEHEKYADFIKILIAHLSFRLRTNIL